MRAAAEEVSTICSSVTAGLSLVATTHGYAHVYHGTRPV